MNKKIINFLLVIILYILLKQYFISNGVPKFLWNIWYNYLAKFNLQTMNYGYTYLEDKSGINNLVNKNKYSLNLYEKVCNLDTLNLSNGNTILEIGSGRGGGIYNFAKKYPNYRFIGLDFSKEAIESSKKKFNLPNLEFYVGNAESLPYNDKSISVVINVESSHCYPNFKNFVSEVRRVLKINGHFCYTDFKDNCFAEIQDQFNINKIKDISLNVLRSLDNMVLTRKKQISECFKIGNLIDKIVLSLVSKEFVGNINSSIYNNLKNGNCVYVLIHATNNRSIINSSSILTNTDIRKVSDTTLPVDVYKNKINNINKKYKNKSFDKPLTVISTYQKYNRKLLKTLSDNFTKPVIFKKCKIVVNDFKLDKKVQIKEGTKIKLIKLNSLNDNMTVFNQMLNDNHFPKLNKIFKKEKLYYDYFNTEPSHVTGIHNEMNSTINIQLKGSKLWKLINPKYSDFLLPFTSKKEKNQYLSMRFGWDKLPSKLNIPYYEVLIEEDDLLFVPSWWWHQPISINRSQHIAIRSVHDDTFRHHIFMPEIQYKFAYLIPLFYKGFDPTSNRDLNEAHKIKQFYKF